MKIRSVLLAAAAIAVFVSASSRAQAQQQIVLDIPGVQGESTIAAFPNQIDLLSASFAAANSACAKTGFTIGELVITKRADKSTADLYAAMQARTVIPTLTVRFARTIDSRVYQQYDLTNALFSASSAAGGSSDTRNAESWNISFSQVVVSYIFIDAKGGSGAPEVVTLTPSVCPGS